jgi:hypothetical protein
VNENLWSHTECLANNASWIIVVVQNTLDKRKIEAVVRKRQLVGIADEKFYRPIPLICIRHSDRMTRRVNADH